MNPAELIRIVEAAGGRFRVNGERLGIDPKEAAAPVLDDLRAHKKEIIGLLACRLQMPAGVRLVHYAPKPAPVRLSVCETVLDTEKFIRSTLLQLDACLRGEKWLSGNWGLLGLLNRLAVCGCICEIESGNHEHGN